jgi:hypothetical protein
MTERAPFMACQPGLSQSAYTAASTGVPPSAKSNGRVAISCNRPMFRCLLNFWRARRGISRESRSTAVILGSSILLCPRAVSITRTAAPARRLSECHDPHSWSVVDESRKLVRACRMAELLKCLRFNLTNALAGHAEFFSDFFKGMIGCAADAETHAQDALLPRC